MRTPGQRPGSRPGGEGTPAEGRAACLGVPSWAGGEDPPDCHCKWSAIQGGGLACFRRQTAPLAMAAPGSRAMAFSFV